MALRPGPAARHLTERQHFPCHGCLDYLSAGRQNRDYSSPLTAIDWDNFYDRLNGGQLVDALREDMKAHYDYTLIDSLVQCRARGLAGPTLSGPPARDIYLSYVAEDWMWADWIEALLSERGIRVLRPSSAAVTGGSGREDVPRGAGAVSRDSAAKPRDLPLSRCAR